MPINKQNILNGVQSSLKTLLKITINKAASDAGLSKGEAQSMLNDIVESNMKINNILIDEILKEIKTNGLVTVTILPGIVGVGVGAASIVNPAPIKITGKIE